MKIGVTQTDIRKGLFRSITSCPVALAICRALNIKKGVEVFSTRLSVGTEIFAGKRFPKQVRKFVVAYDHPNTVITKFRPFTFQLKLENEKFSK